MSVETDIAEIRADMKHVVELAKRHDRTLYGEDGGNGVVSHVTRHNEMEAKANKLLVAVVGLLLANIGTLGKLVWESLTARGN